MVPTTYTRRTKALLPSATPNNFACSEHLKRFLLLEVAPSSVLIRLMRLPWPRSTDLFHAPTALLILGQQPSNIFQLPNVLPAVLLRTVPFPAHQILGDPIASYTMIDNAF